MYLTNRTKLWSTANTTCNEKHMLSFEMWIQRNSSPGEAERRSTYPHYRFCCKSSTRLEKMSLVDGGREFMQDSELEITLQLFVTSQELEAFKRWAIGRQEVVDAVDLGMDDVLEVYAFSDDAANPVAGPLEYAVFYGGEVRKDQNE